MTKDAVRAMMRERRRELSTAWVRACSRAAQERLAALHVFSTAATIGLYMAMPAEVDTALLLAGCRDAGKAVAVPARAPGDRGYRFVRYVDGAGLVAGTWGILEPEGAPELGLGELDLVVVPGVAFGADGGRVGHGGGYYDRLLAGVGATCSKIGLAFDFQVLETVPAENFDVGMDAVVTETRVLGSVA